MTHLAAAFRLGSAALVLVASSPAVAQDSLRAPSQVLLRRLAEAVEGHRHGENVYVVARYDSLSPVAGVFRDRREADEWVRRSRNSAYEVFGPYRYEPPPPREVPPPRLPELPEILIGGCRHDGWTSEMKICPEWALPLDSIDGMTLTVRLRDGRRRSVDLPRTTDAVFLSIPAIDKFVVPYYARIIGHDAASTMRQGIATRAAALRAP